jgi:hypothetical protein
LIVVQIDDHDRDVCKAAAGIPAKSAGDEAQAEGQYERRGQHEDQRSPVAKDEAQVFEADQEQFKQGGLQH